MRVLLAVPTLLAATACGAGDRAPRHSAGSGALPAPPAVAPVDSTVMPLDTPGLAPARGGDSSGAARRTAPAAAAPGPAPRAPAGVLQIDPTKSESAGRPRAPGEPRNTRPPPRIRPPEKRRLDTAPPPPPPPTGRAPA